ncbi:hypothetical protein PybrP1_010927 [[Pythium] brassicae (nom. inval.)]|nr:hypothetical protein PybrP1_010927 [[Pythium] brassicae (nom. inval.)]
MYVMTSFAMPALYLLNKVVLSVYFYCTYARHERTMAAAQTKASGGGMGTVDDDVDADDSDERLTTMKESTGSPPDSLVLPSVLLTAGADQRRLQTVSLWVDEERQDWWMDFRDVKMLKCLTTTTNQKRRLCTSSSVLSGCERLRRLTRAKAGGRTPPTMQLLLYVAQALRYLHALRPPPLLHGNSISQNVLLGYRVRVKLSDFGAGDATAAALSERELLVYSAVGSGCWLSPEALVGCESRARRQGGRGFAAGDVDVYSLGILVEEVDTHALTNRAALPETDVLQLIATVTVSKRKQTDEAHELQ